MSYHSNTAGSSERSAVFWRFPVLLFSWSADDCHRPPDWSHSAFLVFLYVLCMVCTQRTISPASLASITKRESGCWSHCSWYETTKTIRNCRVNYIIKWTGLHYNAEKAIQKRFVILVLDADTFRFNSTFTKYITFLKLCIHKKHIFICIAGKG
jgi:hypothetical protein